MQEIFTYPVDGRAVCQRHPAGAPTGILSLSTPPSPAEQMHPLLPAAQSVQGSGEERALLHGDFAIFETAQVFRDENYTTPYDEREKLPSQRKHRGWRLRGQRQGHDYPVPPGQGRGGGHAPLHPHGGLHPPSGGKARVGRQRGVAEHLSGRGAHRRSGPAEQKGIHGVRHQEPERDAVRAGSGRADAPSAPAPTPSPICRSTP